MYWWFRLCLMRRLPVKACMGCGTAWCDPLPPQPHRPCCWGQPSKEKHMVGMRREANETRNRGQGIGIANQPTHVTTSGRHPALCICSNTSAAFSHCAPAWGGKGQGDRGGAVVSGWRWNKGNQPPQPPSPRRACGQRMSCRERVHGYVVRWCQGGWLCVCFVLIVCVAFRRGAGGN